MPKSMCPAEGSLTVKNWLMCFHECAHISSNSLMVSKTRINIDSVPLLFSSANPSFFVILLKQISSFAEIRSFKGSPYWMAPEVSFFNTKLCGLYVAICCISLNEVLPSLGIFRS